MCLPGAMVDIRLGSPIDHTGANSCVRRLSASASALRSSVHRVHIAPFRLFTVVLTAHVRHSDARRP